MKKNYLIVCFLAFLTQPLFSQNAYVKSWNIEFETNKFRILEEHQETLDEVMTFVNALEYEPDSIVIEGHTDNVGSFKYNQRLSKKRANSVIDYFEENGWNGENIRIGALSFSKPKTNNQTENGRSKNRRTEIRVHYTIPVPPKVEEQVTVEAVIDTSSAVEAAETAEDDFPKVLKIQATSDTIQFEYRCGQDIEIRAVGGVEILIPASAVTNCVDKMTIFARINELTSVHKIIESNASTRAGSRQLRSAGMAFFDFRNAWGSLNFNGCIKMFIPANEVEGIEPFIARTTHPTRANWRRIKEDIQYDNTKKGYWITYCGYLRGGFGGNCDCSLVGVDTPVLLKIRKSARDAPPAIVFQDGTVSTLQPMKANLRKRRHSKYYYLPTKMPFTVVKFYQPPLSKDKGTKKIFKRPTNKVAGRYSRTKHYNWKNRYTKSNIYKISEPVRIKWKKNGKPKNLRTKRIKGTKYKVYRKRHLRFKPVK